MSVTEEYCIQIKDGEDWMFFYPELSGTLPARGGGGGELYVTATFSDMKSGV